ncbi:SDR family oxidoreductase [Natronosporangium hydrolyticum]|uniref:SDR family oxidoreductase n=1 Tax=Natronosporangium hydrolyticum TaxID=2811111 RepID=A0A895YHG3_9ACTN|nr:SDR family oxidoreductase [Natronosporangium hydrolyticum]QSB16981.1 SDR family oxidoreductase [Natronosporangium hydrolyticum]
MHTKTTLAALALGALAVAIARRRRPPADLTGQVALVTGGSRGLGFLLARELARMGCRLVICARNDEELATAARSLAADGAEVVAVPVDLASPEAAELLVARATDRFGRLDILVNNAGVMRVGPVHDMTPGDFSEAVKLMLLAPANLTLAALPQLRAAPAGRIVNITSIGGKVAAPHLLPYCAAKFGMVGFSEGLRAELAGDQISVTTVVPGLMRTGSHQRAEFTGQAIKEYTWFALLASAPLLAMDAERAARRIVAAAARGRREITLTPVAAVATRVAGAAPAATAWLLEVTQRLLPRSADTASPARPGGELAAESPSRIRSALTRLGERAAERLQPAPDHPGTGP